MMRKIVLFVIPLLAVFRLAVAAPDLDLPDSIPDAPFDIRAARMEYTNDTIIAEGGVTGRFENAMIRADRITADVESGDLHVEGNIRFERGTTLWQGSELDYNYLTQSGLFGPSKLFFDPVYLSVGSVERVSTNEFALTDAVFTTCPKDSPHVHARAREARLIDEEYVIAKGVTFYVGNVPVLYVPYWRHRLQSGIFSFKVGYSSSWGPYALITATIPVTRNLNYITDLNLYGTRGVGVGQGVGWKFKDVQGGFSSFYLADQEPNKRFESPLIGDDRYRFKVDHLQNFSPTHYVNTEWNYVSDPYVLKEFFPSEHRNRAQPENYFSWVYGTSTLGTEGFISKRVNDFYDNIDRIQLSADLYRTRLGNSPFYVASENSIAHLERVYNNDNTIDNPYDTVRLDSSNTIYLPQRVGFLSVVPRIGYQVTYYSKTMDNDDQLRGVFRTGVESSFQVNKVLSDTTRWYGQGLRHKLEPYADYIYEEASIDPNRLRQFDEVDQLDDQNKVKLGLRNVLQTQRDGRVARFIDLDLYSYYLLEKNGAPNNFERLYADARMPLTARTMVDLEGEFDMYSGRIDRLNTRISHRKDEVIFSMEHLFENSERSLWTPRINLYPEGSTSFEFYARYDDNANVLEETAVVGYRNWCCMRYGLGYHYYDDGEHRIMFSVGLSAFPEARISSGL